MIRRQAFAVSGQTMWANRHLPGVDECPLPGVQVRREAAAAKETVQKWRVYNHATIPKPRAEYRPSTSKLLQADQFVQCRQQLFDLLVRTHRDPQIIRYSRSFEVPDDDRARPKSGRQIFAFVPGMAGKNKICG